MQTGGLAGAGWAASEAADASNTNQQAMALMQWVTLSYLPILPFHLVRTAPTAYISGSIAPRVNRQPTKGSRIHA
jgi:hypothetical protein